MSIEEFSGGYYRTELVLQPYEDGPVIERSFYDFVDNELYRQTNAPVTMRIGLDGGPYFSPDAEPGVPTDVLALPKDWIDDLEVNDRASEKNVFILKPKHSFLFQQHKNFGDAEESE